MTRSKRPDTAYDALVQQARAYFRDADLSSAERLAREALSHDPQRAAAYNLLAVILARRDRTPEAMDMLRAGLSVEPTDPTAQQNLARLGSLPHGEPLLGDEGGRKR